MNNPELIERICNLEDLLADVLTLLKSPPPIQSLLDVSDVAERLGVSKRTVETLISTGEIKPIRIKGQRRFDRDAIDAYIRRCAEKRPNRRVKKG